MRSGVIPEAAPLFVDAPRRTFRGNQRNQIEEWLRSRCSSQQFVKVASPAAVQLRPTGETYDGFRYTRPAFLQVAQLLSPGLSRCLSELSMESSDGPPSDSLVDFWNAVVVHRFGRLRSARLLVDVDNRLIDGVVNQTVHWIPHQEFWEILQEAAESAPEGTRLWAVDVIGTCMRVWYRIHPPAVEVPMEMEPGWPVFSGFYCVNGEARGSSIRAYAAVTCPAGTALDRRNRRSGVRRSRRVIHAGKRLHQRVMELVASVMRDPIGSDVLAGMVMSALDRRMVSGDSRLTREMKSRVLRGLTRRLQSLGVPFRMAAEVAEQALERGAAGEVSLMHTRYGERTDWDLFAALVRYARELDVYRRERLEVAAYALLARPSKHSKGK